MIVQRTVWQGLDVGMRSPPKPVSIEQARTAIREAQPLLAALQGVIATGIERIAGSYALVVSLNDLPSPDSPLPYEIGGVPVHLRILGAKQRI